LDYWDAAAARRRGAERPQQDSDAGSLILVVGLRGFALLELLTIVIRSRVLDLPRSSATLPATALLLRPPSTMVVSSLETRMLVINEGALLDGDHSFLADGEEKNGLLTRLACRQARTGSRALRRGKWGTAK
jgi:hypothetical protein